MKNKGVDNAGRIVIPKKYRDSLSLGENTPVTIAVENGAVIIRPIANCCKLCGSFIDSNNTFPLCKGCINEIKNSY